MADSIDGIYKCISDCAHISKWCGGLGVCASDIRAKGSLIRGTNGMSTGIVPMLKVFNDTCVYVNQGGSRKGAIAVYLEPHHPDILDFLELRKNHGKEELRARDLFTAVWLNDYFIECVREDKDWNLYCPDECPGLSDAYGGAYKELCERYAKEGKIRKTVKAREVWKAMIVSQIETGTPYMLNKDASNLCSNQKNIGTIKNSNLCVSGDTKVLTDKGNLEIKTLVGQVIKVWNGTEYTSTVVYQTGVYQPLMRITFSNGSRICCTPYHRFFIEDGTIIEASKLKVRDNIETFTLPSGESVSPHVVSLETGLNGDTYCFTEPKVGKGVFNGILEIINNNCFRDN